MKADVLEYGRDDCLAEYPEEPQADREKLSRGDRSEW